MFGQDSMRSSRIPAEMTWTPALTLRELTYTLSRTMRNIRKLRGVGLGAGYFAPFQYEAWTRIPQVEKSWYGRNFESLIVGQPKRQQYYSLT